MDKMISLRTKTFRVILVVSLVLILLGSVAGLALYGYSSLHNYKIEARNLINYTLLLEDQSYLDKIFRETKKIYWDMPDEIRKDSTTKEFQEKFYPLLDEDFFAARDILVKCREGTGQKNVSYMFTDPSLNAIVFVVDGDEEEWAYVPGQWIPGNLSAIKRIERSSWQLHITHEDEYGWVGTDYAAMYDSNGKKIGYAVMDLDLNDFLGRIFRFLWVLLPTAAALVLLLAFLSSGLLRRHIISHLIDMAAAAREYTARDKVDQPDDAPYVFEALQIRTSDELEELWRSMSEMETDFRDTMIRLRQITAEQERMGAELSIATKIQEGTLPKEFPPFPDRTEFDIYASMHPAKEVGGDLYDFFLVDEDHLALVIADVSGKGISAALFMVIAKTMIRSQVRKEDQDPAEAFNNMNLKLMEINKARLFITAWLGILTISTGELKYVNAGHEYPAIRRAGGSFALEKDVHSIPLAASKKAKFRSGTFTLDPGDTIYVYTDGVTEANDENEELFGTERMLDALNRDPDAEPRTIDQHMQEAIAAFAKEAPRFDDTTMLCMKYYGPADPQTERASHES